VFHEVTKAREHALIWPKVEATGRPDVNLTVCHCQAPELETPWTALTAGASSASR
jgi:hypothetical protein